MPKKDHPDQPPAKPGDVRSLYTDDVLDQIIAATADQRPHGIKELPEDEIEIGSPTGRTGGETFVRQARRDALRERIEVAVERYLLSTKIQARPSQLTMADDYKAMEANLNRTLMDLLPADRAARGRKHATLAMGLRDGDVRRRIVAVAELHRAARSARKRKRAKPKIPRSKRHPGDQPLDELIADLVVIYEQVFGREAGSSTASGSARGAAGGPMIRFIRAALAPLLAKVPTEHAIRARVAKVMGSTRKKT